MYKIKTLTLFTAIDNNIAVVSLLTELDGYDTTAMITDQLSLNYDSTEVDTILSNIMNKAPVALNTLSALAQA